MSGDSQGNRWWLASNGKWYPPDLHPSVRASPPDEQDRNAALLDATIGVARVRERVFAEVLREPGPEEASFSGKAEGAPRRAVRRRTPNDDTPKPRGAPALSGPGDARLAVRHSGAGPCPAGAPRDSLEA